jgi:hypothetical protein
MKEGRLLLRKFVFSRRYSSIIDVGNGKMDDSICGEIPYITRKRISGIMREFAEPQKYQRGRYDNDEVVSDALTEAAFRLNDILGYDAVNSNMGFIAWSGYDNLSLLFTPHLFDLIELQCSELSSEEAIAYQREINDLFQDDNIPWLLCDGRMIKIDPVQFELDLKAKAIEKLNILKDSEPKFQAPFDELVKACELCEKNQFDDAISSAEKSYESVLKIACGESRGTADKLCSNFIARYLDDCLPSSMTADGFKRSVMLALPYIRNNSGAAHGAGADNPIIPRELANLSINLAAALNVFVIEYYKKTPILDATEEPTLT